MWYGPACPIFCDRLCSPYPDRPPRPPPRPCLELTVGVDCDVVWAGLSHTLRFTMLTLSRPLLEVPAGRSISVADWSMRWITASRSKGTACSTYSNNQTDSNSGQTVKCGSGNSRGRTVVSLAMPRSFASCADMAHPYILPHREDGSACHRSRPAGLVVTALITWSLAPCWSKAHRLRPAIVGP